MKGHASSVQVFIITGFLGSGKTSFLSHVLEQLADNFRIGVIVNEFASACIDDQTLLNVKKSFSLTDIHNGLISCVCRQDDFIKSLDRMIRDFDPEMVFIEASGLSDPLSLLDSFNAPVLVRKLNLAHIWCMIDAHNFLRISDANTLVNHQVIAADSIIINKTDLVPVTMQNELGKKIHAVNPLAELMYAKFGKVDLSAVISSCREGSCISRADEAYIDPYKKKPAMQVGVIRSARPINGKNAQEFIKEIMPGVSRIKGFFRLSSGKRLAVQTVFDLKYTEEVAGNDMNTLLVIIGSTVDSRSLSRKYREMSEHT